MVPKDSGFNQSETAHAHPHRDVFEARLPWQEMVKQHFYHHGDTICHPKSGYVTTKLHGTYTCRCKNKAIFSDRAIFQFPADNIYQPRLSGRGEALAVHAKLKRWQHC